MNSPVWALSDCFTASAKGYAARAEIAPRTGQSSSRLSRRSLASRRPALAWARAGRAGAAWCATGSAMASGASPLAVVPGLAHGLLDLRGRLLHRLLGRDLAGEGGVEVGAEDGLDRVPLVGARAPVGAGLQRLGQRGEVGVLLVEGRVVEQAEPAGDAALGDVLLLDVGRGQPLDEVGRRLAVLGRLGDAEQPVAHHPEALAARAGRDRGVGDFAADLGDRLVLDDLGDLAGPDGRLVRLPARHQPRAVGRVDVLGALLADTLEVVDKELDRLQGGGRVDHGGPVVVDDVAAERPQDRQ